MDASGERPNMVRSALPGFWPAVYRTGICRGGCISRTRPWTWCHPGGTLNALRTPKLRDRLCLGQSRSKVDRAPCAATPDFTTHPASCARFLGVTRPVKDWVGGRYTGCTGLTRADSPTGNRDSRLPPHVKKRPGRNRPGRLKGDRHSAPALRVVFRNGNRPSASRLSCLHRSRWWRLPPTDHGPCSRSQQKCCH